MNKDCRFLTRTERQMLILSDSQLLLEMSKKTQLYFKPDHLNFSENSEQSLASLLQCVVCKEIPFDLRQCVACEAVICMPCKVRLQEQEERLVNHARAQGKSLACFKRQGCPSCGDNPELFLESVKNGQIMRSLSKYTESHCCGDHCDHEEEQCEVAGEDTDEMSMSQPQSFEKIRR